MKRRLLPMIIIGMLLSLYACKKDGLLATGSNSDSKLLSTNAVTTAITGKWNIVSDSTFVGFAQNSQPYNYAGLPGDYFDIRTNGYIYTKEGSVLDTLSYTIVSNTGMIIQSFGIALNGVPEVSHITNLTANSVIIDAPTILTPANPFGRKVTLSR